MVLTNQKPDRSIAPGEQMLFQASPLPVGTPTVLSVGLGSNLPGLGLGPVGAPGCSLYTTGEINVPMNPSGSRSRLFVTLPEIHCSEFHLQAIALIPGVNPLGGAASNGVTMTVRPTVASLLHTSNRFTVVGDRTRLVNTPVDRKPGAAPLVSRVWNPNGAIVGNFNRHEIALSYDPAENYWFIANQDQAAGLGLSGGWLDHATVIGAAWGGS